MTTQELKKAIDRSRSHTEIVSVDATGNQAELVEVLSGLYDGEIDATVVDDETVDVWGYRADAPLGSAEWGLRISLRADAELGNSL